MSDVPQHGCPKCGYPFLPIPDAAGVTALCSRCEARESSDAPGRSPPSASRPAFAFEADDGPASSGRPIGREPWFIRFLEGYTLIAMWIGLAVLALGLSVATVLFARGLFAYFQDQSPLTLADLSLVFLINLAAIGGGLIVVLFSAALVLLGVDVARNLRTLVAQGRRRG